MIILDTNVVSALLHPRREGRISSWLDEQRSRALWTTSITIYEVRAGIELLAAGRRRDELDSAFRDFVEQGLDGRVLSFDVLAAEQTGVVTATRRRAGRPVEIRDTQIAGIALAHQAALATRNVRHFSDLPITIIDPWTAEQ